MQLNQPIQLLSTLRLCGFPCNGLAPISRSSLSLRCTSDTYSSTCTAYLPLKRRTEADKARIQSMYCLLDERESSNERLFTDTMLAIFYQFDRI